MLNNEILYLTEKKTCLDFVEKQTTFSVFSKRFQRVSKFQILSSIYNTIVVLPLNHFPKHTRQLFISGMQCMTFQSVNLHICFGIISIIFQGLRGHPTNWQHTLHEDTTKTSQKTRIGSELYIKLKCKQQEFKKNNLN